MLRRLRARWLGRRTPRPLGYDAGHYASHVVVVAAQVVAGMLAILITVAYAALLPILHYVAATLLASVAMLALLGARRLSVLIIYPLVLTFAAQYAFTTVVGVILP